LWSLQKKSSEELQFTSLTEIRVLILQNRRGHGSDHSKQFTVRSEAQCYG
jgi:hypothetical protein